MRFIQIDKDSKGTIATYWSITLGLAIISVLFIKTPWILVPILLFLAVFAFFMKQKRKAAGKSSCCGRRAGI